MTSVTTEMELVVGADGAVGCIYDEALDLREIGKLQITRASHVEPDRDGFWWADMGPVGGPVLGPFKNRTEALQAEREWLLQRCRNDGNQRLATKGLFTPTDFIASPLHRSVLRAIGGLIIPRSFCTLSTPEKKTSYVHARSADRLGLGP